MNVELEKRLAKIREDKDNPYLPTSRKWNNAHPLLPFQKVGVSHLVTKSRFILGDPTGTGKTPQELAAYSIIEQTRPLRLMVITTKSAAEQWLEEVEKFLPGTPTFLVPSVDKRGNNVKAEKRYEQYRNWIGSPYGSVISLNWGQFVNDWPELEKTIDVWGPTTMVALDEFQKAKNPKAKLSQTVAKLLDKVSIAHGLTATLVKNKAHDAQALIELLKPGTMSLTVFEALYCIWNYPEKIIKNQKTGKFNRQKVREHGSYQKLDDFNKRIAHLYLGRTDEELDKQRPETVHMTRRVEMNAEHRKLYLSVEQGNFTENAHNSEVAASAALGQALTAASCPEAYPHNLFETDPAQYSKMQESNSKLELLKELLETELEGEPVIIYSPYKGVINHYQRALKSYNPVRITGDEDGDERTKARLAFMNGKTNVMMLTNAGGEALNLQRGKHIIMLNRPWDPGTYVQLVGRIRRFNSEHTYVTLWHLTVRDTVDELVDAVMVDKFGPFDQIVRGRGNLVPDSEALPMEVVRRARAKRLREVA
jgi:superfamily II DNA or RNA helicase